jgi:hypothetical protein
VERELIETEEGVLVVGVTLRDVVPPMSEPGDIRRPYSVRRVRVKAGRGQDACPIIESDQGVLFVGVTLNEITDSAITARTDDGRLIIETKDGPVIVGAIDAVKAWVRGEPL